MLHEFLGRHHEAIVAASRARLLGRMAPQLLHPPQTSGVAPFLRQLRDILEREETNGTPDGEALGGAPSQMNETASRRGGELRHAGFSIAQVVQAYGDVCQAITQLASELDEPVTAEEFKTLNRCLDEVIAEAVTEFARQRDLSVAGETNERLGVFAHELRNLLNNAVLAYDALRTGTIGIESNTGKMLGRSLDGLRKLVDNSLAEVRLESGKNHPVRVALDEFMEEIELVATIAARATGQELAVTPVPPGVVVQIDRQLVAAALGNLLQNAFKFTGPRGQVVLRTDTATAPDRVLISVEDECGGLPVGFSSELFEPFRQAGSNQSGLGLGLGIARGAIEKNGGTLRVRDVPGKGCVFTVDLPRAPTAGPDRHAAPSA